LAIEFYCSACEAYLRAPDEKAGLSTNCPHCSTGIWIPLESDAIEIDEEDLEWEEAEEDLVSVLQDDDPSFNDEARQEFAEPDEVDLSKILSDTWQIFTRNWKACVAVTVVDSLLTIVALFVTFMIGGIAAAMAANNPGTAVLAFLAITGLGLGVLLSMFAVGHIRFYLELCRNENPVLKKSVNFQGPVGRMLIGGVVYWGLFIFIFPPIFLWPYGRVLMDKERSSLGSISTALRLSAKHSGVSFALFLVKFGALFASTLIPVVGTILVTPYLATLNTVAYLHFIGELE